MTHSSGLPDVCGETEQDAYTKGIVDARKDYTEEELTRIYLRLPFEFQPGERWNYCSTGYALLGFMIHRVTGMFYGDFEPTGLNTSINCVFPGPSRSYSLPPEANFRELCYNATRFD